MDTVPDFNEHMVLIGVESPDKWALLERLVQLIERAPTMLLPGAPSRDVVLSGVLERERDKATGLAHGFAFPHARIVGLSHPIMAVATLHTPLDFEAMDGQPVEVVAMLVVPDEHPQVALKIMSQFARLVSDPLEYEVLRSLHEPRLFAAFVARQVLGAAGPITARDIMRVPYADVHPETPLREVTRIMMQFRLDAVAVVEEDRTLVGEISSERVFRLGLPDFFGQLKSVSFISAFDPFEKYFEGEGSLLARDVMTQDYAAIPETATLLEIVFELAVKRRAKVHVVRDGKRIGVIDRALVLDRVINL
jgi:mannitol/fructose-specific phosphotransferase system IIA component (Ntr-type)/predicted transcriptional regulator